MRYISTMLLALVAVFAIACSDDDTNAPQAQEFIAADADFADFTAWSQTITPRKGPDPAGLIGGAHNSGDTSLTRRVFVSDANASRDSYGHYPLGTRLVKEVRAADGSVAVVTAMVKRGGSFNSSNRNWEWFMLNADGTIIDRGANLLGGACNACHAQSASKDYVFTK